MEARPALPSAVPPSPRRAAPELTPLLQVPAGPEGRQRKTALRSSPTLLLPPPSAPGPFPGRTPRRAEGGRAPRAGPLLQSDLPLPHRPSLFPFISPSYPSAPLTPTPEPRREARCGWWASRAESARGSPLSGCRGGEATQARDPCRSGQAGPSPTPSAPPQVSSRFDARPARGLGPGAPLEPRAAAGARGSPAFSTGSQGSFSASPQPAPPRLRGSGAPAPAGVHSGLELRERRTQRAPPRMAGLTAVGGLARGATRKLSAQVCVPWKKRLSLTMHKGEPPRPSPEKPGSGRGVAGGWGARRRGGGGRRRSLGRADERGADGCSTAATNVFAEKFCSQVGGREIVTQFKAGKSTLKTKPQKEQRAAVCVAVLPPRSAEAPGEEPQPRKSRETPCGSGSSQARQVRPGGAGSLPVACAGSTSVPAPASLQPAAAPHPTRLPPRPSHPPR